MYDAFAYFCDMLSDKSVLFIPHLSDKLLLQTAKGIGAVLSVVEMDKSSLLDVCCMLDGYPISVEMNF